MKKPNVGRYVPYKDRRLYVYGSDEWWNSRTDKEIHQELIETSLFKQRCIDIRR